VTSADRLLVASAFRPKINTSHHLPAKVASHEIVYFHDMLRFHRKV
jgi:hypothetical protein